MLLCPVTLMMCESPAASSPACGMLVFSHYDLLAPKHLPPPTSSNCVVLRA